MNNTNKIEIAPAKEYLHALLYYPNYVKLIEPKDKPYEKVHQWLLRKHNFMSDENSRFPTIKEIATELSIDQTKFKNLMIKLYDDIIELNHEKPHLFASGNQILCDLYFKGFRASASFSLGLNAIPRIKDSFTFRFIEPRTQSNYFHVTQITHEIHSNGHEICVWLDVRGPNMYLELLKEKAHFRGGLSIMELSGYPNPYSLEEKLRKMYSSL
jgi:hypothetical protein